MAEYSAANVLLRRYAHGVGADVPVVWFEGSATSFAAQRQLYTDHQGSVVAVGLNDGSTLAQGRYDEFGIPQAGNAGRFQYTGQAWLADIGLYYYKARMYSPTLGRFMQTDPIGYGDGLNWMNYVHGDPVNRRDPSGLEGIVVRAPSITPKPSDCSGAEICVAATNDGPQIWGVPIDFPRETVVYAGPAGAEETVDNNTIVVVATKPKPQSVADTAKKYAKKLGQCAADEFGLTALGGALAGAGANILDAGGKFSGATPGTSLASRAAGSILGDLQLPRALPTLTGFPGIGNGLRLSSTLSAARFAGRAVPVIGYALLAYDAYKIGKCVATGD